MKSGGQILPEVETAPRGVCLVLLSRQLSEKEIENGKRLCFQQESHLLVLRAGSFQHNALSLVSFTGLKLLFQGTEEKNAERRFLLTDYNNHEVSSLFIFLREDSSRHS